MKPVDAHPDLAKMVRILRIIVGGIALGLFGFLAVVTYLHFVGGNDQPPTGAGLLTSIALAVAGVIIVGFSLVRIAMIRAACDAYRQEDVPAFQQKYGTAVLLGAAGIEGAGFLLGVAFLVEKDLMTLTAAGICLVLVVFAMPSRGRVDHMLEMLP